MNFDTRAKFNLSNSNSIEFIIRSYEFKFDGRFLPSMTLSDSGDPLVLLKDNFKISKKLDSHTVELSALCARGVVIPLIEIFVTIDALSTFSYKLHNARIHSHSVDGLSGYTGGHWEQLDLSFCKIVWSMESKDSFMSGSNSLNTGEDRGLCI